MASIAILVSLPASAGTGSKLQDAKNRLAVAKAELDQKAVALNSAETRLALIERDLADTRAEIDDLQRQLAASQRALEQQARDFFMFGGQGGTLAAILGSQSFADFADRIEFASTVVQSEEDLATRVQVERAQLARDRVRLSQRERDQAKAVADLRSQERQIQSQLSDLQSEVDRLQKELNRQQRAQVFGGGGPVASGAIQVCPVHGPVGFTDSFGEPRPGGRIHEGIDMFAPEGTPIVAVHAGTAARTPNSLGGNAVTLSHDGGSDFTYYAHMSAYGAAGHVAVGEVIGYVGHTGDTTVNHLHFEYHPGGGAAVDPYQSLLAVC